MAANAKHTRIVMQAELSVLERQSVVYYGVLRLSHDTEDATFGLIGDLAFRAAFLYSLNTYQQHEWTTPLSIWHST